MCMTADCSADSFDAAALKGPQASFVGQQSDVRVRNRMLTNFQLNLSLFRFQFLRVTEKTVDRGHKGEEVA